MVSFSWPFLLPIRTFEASTHSLHLLRQTDLQSIISSLHRNRQLKLGLNDSYLHFCVTCDLALSLLKTTTSIDPEELEKYKQRINQMQAFEYFCTFDFEHAIEKYIESKCDPVKVIGLFPDLLPKSTTAEQEDRPQLSGVELLDAYRALIRFLTYHRDQLLKAEIRNVEKLKIVDTVLLKTYVHASPTMVKSLLRVKDNFCIYSECEKVLRDAGKMVELVLLMKKEGKHERALNLLVDSELDDKIELIIDYLATCDGAFNVALSFGRALLRTHPTIGLALFTADIAEAEKWPRDRVYELFKQAKVPIGMTILLVEHYVYEWRDESEQTLHWLILAYRANIVDLRNAMLEQVEQDSTNHTVGPSGDTLLAVDELNEARRKLVDLLENSDNYSADHVLAEFESGDWIEEKTCLLAKLGRHKQVSYIKTKSNYNL